MRILLCKTIQLDTEVGIESFLQNFNLTCNLRKIQEQYLVNSLQGCRMLPYPQTTEEFFETLLLVTVIVRVEHTEKQALSKTTGTDEEEIAASPALAKKSSYRHNRDSDSSPWQNQILRMVLVLLAVSSCYEI